MKIVLFDEINETHVCDALATGLDDLGHAVFRTGPVWKGHAFATSPEAIASIDARIDEALAAGPDWWLNFRASSLTAGQVERIRRAGVRAAVWFPDDPVLYELCYSKIVDAYDLVLHCGGRQVLDFYRYRGHRIGINFPFWVDLRAWPLRYEPDACDRGPVFYGNMHGVAKRSRYEALCAVAPDVSLYGRLADDPLVRGRGVLNGPHEAAAALPRHRLGLNAPQRFADYAGSAYDFAGLALLGTFFLPSRVVQYAALGLPTLTLHAGAVVDAGHYPPGLHARDVAQARAVVERISVQPDLLRGISLAARGDVERFHTGGSRARLLAALFDGTIEPERLTPHEQEFGYRFFCDAPTA